MNQPFSQLDTESLLQTNPQDAQTLETILDAWHTATQRLQHTHEALRNEVGRLTDELEIKNRQLERKNRLADLGQMASHVAHEVRNSLVPMTLYLSLLRRRLDNQGDLEVMEKIDSGFTALEATVSDLLQFTSQHDPQRQQFDLPALLQEISDSLEPQLIAQGIVTVINAPPNVILHADRDMLRRAVLNLVLNALDVMPEGGKLTITTCQTSKGTEIHGTEIHGTEITVADSGPGVEPAAQDRVFEPFFTTKSGGTGLGLAIVYRIAEVHDGEITVGNGSHGGATFTLWLPNKEMEQAA